MVHIIVTQVLIIVLNLLGVIGLAGKTFASSESFSRDRVAHFGIVKNLIQNLALTITELYMQLLFVPLLQLR